MRYNKKEKTAAPTNAAKLVKDLNKSMEKFSELLEEMNLALLREKESFLKYAKTTDKITIDLKKLKEYRSSIDAYDAKCSDMYKECKNKLNSIKNIPANDEVFKDYSKALRTRRVNDIYKKSWKICQKYRDLLDPIFSVIENCRDSK